MPTQATEQTSSLETEACLMGDRLQQLPFWEPPSPTIPFKSNT